VLKRNLGRMAELELPRWAAAHGFSAQLVQDDRTGWDYLLEFPIEAQVGPGGMRLPLDKASAPLQCLVQVKATATLSRTWGVGAKLASCFPLALTPLPAFFLLLRYGSGDSPVEAFLLPVDKVLLGRILQRVRKAEAGDQKTNRLKLYLQGTGATRIQACGDALKRAIRAHVNVSMEDYAAAKKTWRQGVGYEDQSGTVSFRITEPIQGDRVLTEELINLALGLREPLAVADVKIADVRFGIQAPGLIAQLDHGFLEIAQEPVASVDVHFQSGVAVARLKMELYVPKGLAAVIDPSLLKWRLRHPFIDLVLGDSSMNASLTVPEFGQQESLRRLYELASFVQVVEAAAGHQNSMTISITYRESTLQRHLEIPPHLAIELAKLSIVIRDAWKVARHLEVEDEVQTSLKELLTQARKLSFFAVLIDPARVPFSIEFSSGSEMELTGKRICVPFGVAVRLGHITGAVVAAFWGSGKQAPNGPATDRYSVDTFERTAERIQVGRREEGLPSISSMVQSVAEGIDDSVICVIPSDLK
jgi:hypothetical protein